MSCVVPHDGAALDAEQLVAFLRERLASYKVPRHVLFCHADEVALTGNAQVKAGELRGLTAERVAADAGQR